MNKSTNTLKLVPCVIAKDAVETEFPIGSLVVLDHDTCPFDDVEGTGEVVPMPEGIVHGPGAVAVVWQVCDDVVSAPYDPAFLKPLIPFEAFERHDELLRENRREAEEAAQQWQIRKMSEWLAKPIGNAVTPGDIGHRTICAIQIIREQVPAFSINKLADEAGIARTTLKNKLRGDRTMTTIDVFRLAHAMDVVATDVIALSEKGSIVTPADSTPATEEWNPDGDNRPAPGIVPSGFNPWDAQWDFFKGKEMSGKRWKIESDWTLETGEFALSFWTTDDDPMTADESREFAAAMLEMGVYITTMSNTMNACVEASK